MNFVVSKGAWAKFSGGRGVKNALHLKLVCHLFVSSLHPYGERDHVPYKRDVGGSPSRSPPPNKCSFETHCISHTFDNLVPLHSLGGSKLRRRMIGDPTLRVS